MSTDCVVEVESRKWKVKSQDGKRSVTLSSSVNHVQMPVVRYDANDATSACIFFCAIAPTV